MRVLGIEPGPAFSVADCHRGWMSAFRQLGCDVVNFNFADRLDFYDNVKLERHGEVRKAVSTRGAIEMAAKGIEAAAFEWWPDIVFITSAFFVPAFTFDILRSRRMKVVLLHTESPYEDDKQVERAKHADLNLINDPTNIERFREVAPTEYMPHAYDPEIHHPREPKDDLRSDFFFVGTGYPSRVEFFEAVDWRGVDVKLGGHWQSLSEDSPLRPFVVHDIDQCMDNGVAVDFYGSTECSANLYRTEADDPSLSAGWSMGPREVELAASGTFFLRQPRPEGDEVLKMLPTFSSPEEFGHKLRWHLANNDVRRCLADAAQEAVADRTFVSHASQLLRLLDA